MSFDEDALGEAYEKGLAAEKQGDVARACDAYEKCLTIDPADHVGARIRLAGLGRLEAPLSVGDAYVATLFDQHAEAFEDILVRQLDYGVPDLLAHRLKITGQTYRRMLDLGCGTGLVGEAFEQVADMKVGVDLSEEMVRIAGEKQIYDRLFVAEAGSFLAANDDPASFDLIMAADVLPYIGDLSSFFGHVERRLEMGGRFGFSTETMSEDELAGRPYAVGRDQRFHHSEDYIRDTLSEHHLTLEHFSQITVRMQNGHPAPGHLVVAEKGPLA